MTTEHIMKNNLIFQYLITDDEVDNRGSVKNQYTDETVSRSSLYKSMAEISRKSFEMYAEHIGCQYMYSEEKWLTRGHNHGVSPLYEILRIVYDPMFDQYDDILFTDIDIVVNTKENIFDHQPEGCEISGVLESDVIIDRTMDSGGYNSWDYDITAKQDFNEKFNMHDCPVVPTLGYPTQRNSSIFIYNTGVLIWTKKARLKARKLFDPWQHWLYPKIFDIKSMIHHMHINCDQPFISAQLMKHNFDVGLLPQEWNDTPVHYDNPMDWVNQKDGKKCYFLHFAGGNHKFTMIKWYEENLFPIFRGDWK